MDGCAQLRCSVSNVQLVLTCFHHTESFSFPSLFSAQLQLSHTGCYFLRANERERERASRYKVIMAMVVRCQSGGDPLTNITLTEENGKHGERAQLRGF